MPKPTRPSSTPPTSDSPAASPPIVPPYEPAAKAAPPAPTSAPPPKSMSLVEAEHLLTQAVRADRQRLAAMVRALAVGSESERGLIAKAILDAPLP